MSNNRNGKGILIQEEGSRRKSKEFDHSVKIEEESSECTPSRTPPPPSLPPPTKVESVEISPRNQRRRLNHDPEKPDVKVEETSSFMAVALPPPRRPLPIYTICPICLGPMVEETATECGHLFCSDCISRALSVQGKCPECQRVTTHRKLRRIFFPSSV